MDNAILIGLSRQSAMMRQMSVIANNIANMNTSGYKSQSMLFDEYVMPVASEASPDKSLSFVQDLGQFRNVADGAIQTTGNPLDVAITGEGFFKVQTAQGVRYTRDGHFQLDGSGQLVTQEGNPVLSDSGSPITFGADEGEITIARDGTITTSRPGTANSEQVRGKLGITTFANLQDMKSEENNLLSTTQTESPVQSVRVVQGSIEASNVKPIVEMTNMMTVQRSYESAQKLIEAADDMRRQAISQIAAAA
ncbi:flagellar basal-body rod protein FlgF [Parvibaculum sp.]|uniref:flagellar basal-body rod protein FlgF n=1 Tax=Parvibaculum sp. TaxID=2024848 RepID=UPI0032103808